MSTPNSEKIILITGINGYLASVTGLKFLKKGYTLRGTCRSPERVQRLLDGGYREYAHNIEIFEVPDMTIPGAFDEAVKGVHAIVHMAAPTIGPKIKVASDVIRPTIDGTVSILNSALVHAGPQLESFVFTSSAAACINPHAKAPHTYTEASWNEHHEDMAAKQGEATPPYVAYPAGKVAAEKVVWTFRSTHQPFFACTSVNGAIATGPPVQLPVSADDLALTVQPVYKALVGDKEAGPQDKIGNIIGTAPYVDVRDLATIFSWAVEHPRQADGQRYLGVAGHGARQALFDTLRAVYPERRGVIDEGNPGQGYNPDFSFPENSVKFDSTKTATAIGLKWISYDKSIRDTAAALEPLL